MFVPHKSPKYLADLDIPVINRNVYNRLLYYYRIFEILPCLLPIHIFNPNNKLWVIIVGDYNRF